MNLLELFANYDSGCSWRFEDASTKSMGVGSIYLFIRLSSCLSLTKSYLELSPPLALTHQEAIPSQPSQASPRLDKPSRASQAEPIQAKPARPSDTSTEAKPFSKY